MTHTEISPSQRRLPSCKVSRGTAPCALSRQQHCSVSACVIPIALLLFRASEPSLRFAGSPRIHAGEGALQPLIMRFCAGMQSLLESRMLFR
jgi:hypothetical protein